MPAPERPTRIGIFGGTFDPPHAGHVAAARAVMEQLGLDRLLLVVANDPWQKSGARAVSPAEDRYALTDLLAVILVIVVGTIRLIGNNANNVFSSVASSIAQ